MNDLIIWLALFFIFGGVAGYLIGFLTGSWVAPCRCIRLLCSMREKGNIQPVNAVTADSWKAPGKHGRDS